MKFHYLVLFLLLVVQKHAFSSSSDTTKNWRHILAPVLYYSEETRWGYGAGGVSTFRYQGNKSYPLSFLQGGFSFTQKKQLLSYLYTQIYFNKHLRFWGEIGYYNYYYLFHGIGGEPALVSNPEKYSVRFPRVRLSVVRNFKDEWFAGFRFWYENFNITKVEDPGILSRGSIIGSSGGTTSSPGLILGYDSRDVKHYPGKGVFFESAVMLNNKLWFSNFNYSVLHVSISRYFSIQQHRLALNFIVESNDGEIPFNQLAKLGGNKNFRGYYRGQFRDKKMFMVRSEYRIPLFWRFKLAAFGGIGAINNKFREFSASDFKYAYGLGGRLLIREKEQLHLRFDIGFGEKSNALIFTVGEAF